MARQAHIVACPCASTCRIGLTCTCASGNTHTPRRDSHRLPTRPWDSTESPRKKGIPRPAATLLRPVRLERTNRSRCRSVEDGSSGGESGHRNLRAELRRSSGARLLRKATWSATSTLGPQSVLFLESKFTGCTRAAYPRWRAARSREGMHKPNRTKPRSNKPLRHALRKSIANFSLQTFAHAATHHMAANKALRIATKQTARTPSRASHFAESARLRLRTLRTAHKTKTNAVALAIRAARRSVYPQSPCITPKIIPTNG